MDPYSPADLGPKDDEHRISSTAGGPRDDNDEHRISSTANGPRDEREPRYNEEANRFALSAARILDQCEDNTEADICEFISRELEGLAPLDDGRLGFTHKEGLLDDPLRITLRRQIMVYTFDTESLLRLVRAYKKTTGEYLFRDVR